MNPRIEMKLLTASLLVSVLVAAASNCLIAAEAAGGGIGAVCKIAAVTDFDQLRSQRPIRLGDDWEVRFGLGYGGTEAGPWRLLYCLANWTNENESPSLAYKGESLGEPLGPVFYRVSMDRQTPLAECGQMMFAAEEVSPEGVYCEMIITAWQGRYHVEIFSRDDRIIARRTIDVAQPRVLYWQEFALQKGTISKSPVAARPEFVGTWPLWENGGRVASQLHRRCPLPGSIPTPTAWIDYVGTEARAIRDGERIYPLKLSLKDGQFVIQSPVRLVDWPDYYLLARWWVNGKPVLPRRPEEMSMRSIGRQVSFTKEMQIPFGLPDPLGTLKVGDKVGLQVLYSPAMIEQVPISPISLALLRAVSPHDANVAAMPMTSNRIEFAVTEAMLLP